MSKFAIAGVVSLIFAALVFGYQAISSVMGPKATYKTVYPVDILDPAIVEWIDGIPSETVFKIVDFIITTPLQMIFIVIGVVLLVISSFRWR